MVVEGARPRAQLPERVLYLCDAARQPQVPALPTILDTRQPLGRPVAVGLDPMDSKGARQTWPPPFKRSCLELLWWTALHSQVA